MPKRISIANSAQSIQRSPSNYIEKLRSSLYEEGADDNNSPDFRYLSIESLTPNRYQPRDIDFNDPSLQELAVSIREQGLLQPILVRPSANPDVYEIIAGERRWRAAQQAQLEKVPVLVREADDRTAAILALLENMQRQDLNPIEEAYGLKKLSEEFSFPQTQIATLLGRSKTYISRALGLLELNSQVKNLVREGLLSAGHAKVLLDLTAEDQQKLAQLAIENDWSVRKLEQYKTMFKSGHTARQTSVTSPDPNITDLQSRLSQHLATQVEVKTFKHGGGKIIISFHDNEICQGVLNRIGIKD